LKGPRMVWSLLPSMAGICAGIFIITTFLSIGLSPASPSYSGQTNVRVFFNACAVLTGIFSLVFAWFSASYYCHTCRREIALGSIFGIRARIFFSRIWGEFARAAFLAGGAGITAALVLNRFFALVLGYLMRGRIAMVMPISPAVLIAALLIIAAQTAVAAPAIALSVRNASADILFRSEEPGSGHPRRFRTMAGFALLAAGYVVATASNARFSILSMLAALATVVAGTFLSMEGILSLVLGFLRKRLDAMSVPFRLALTQLSFDLRRNASMLAMVTVFVAIATATGGAIFAFASNERIQVDRLCPNGLELTSMDHAALSRAIARIEDSFGQAPLQNSSAALAFRTIESLRIDLTVSPSGARFPAQAMAFSTWESLMKDSGRETTDFPKENEILGTGYFAGDFGIRSFSRVLVRTEGGTTIEGFFRVIPEGYPLSSSTVLRQLILSDSDWKRLAAVSKETAFSFSALWNPKDSDWFRCLGPGFRSALEDVRKMGIVPRLRIDSLDAYRRDSGALLFIGVLVMAAFLALALSSLAFKQWGNLSGDRTRMAILNTLGTRSRDAERAIHHYIAATFLVPLALGILHSVFAFRMLANISRFAVHGAAMVAILLTAFSFMIAIEAISVRYTRDAKTRL
jgi:putative ABC transport system permease protein